MSLHIVTKDGIVRTEQIAGYSLKGLFSLLDNHFVQCHKSYILKSSADDLKSLTYIASGGAELNIMLVEGGFSKLGEVLYNLYGTFEAGVNMIGQKN